MGRFVIVNGIGNTVVAFRGALVRDLVARGHEVIVSTPRPVERGADAVEDEVRALGGQAWLTGTEPELFRGLEPWAEFLIVAEGQVMPAAEPRRKPS